jgi:hypothetical protein
LILVKTQINHEIEPVLANIAVVPEKILECTVRIRVVTNIERPGTNKGGQGGNQQAEDLVGFLMQGD